MTNYFNSKYPIIALAMNQVSDAKFAIECSNAGIYPSISLFNYYKNNTINYERFIRETTLNNFMLSLTILDLKNKYVLTLIKKLDRKSTRLNSSHVSESRMPSSA